MRGRFLASGLAVLLGGGCARQAAPPGGPPDQRPPVVVATVPEPFADVPEFRGPVRLTFDERISEQVGGGTLEEAVTVSPRTGEVRVERGRQRLEVRVDGGFQPGVVYRVTLRPGVQDLFGNSVRDPFELVFTTGAEAVPTTVAGEVWDRVSGQALAGLAVQAVGPDSIPYVATTDESGIYALRYVPGGRYTLQAFEDRNRNHALDPGEPVGARPLEIAAGDTAFVDLPVLAPDTTAAVLGGAEALDSVTVVLTFDDALEPTAPLDEVRVELASDSVEAPAVARLEHEAFYARRVEEVRDSLRRAAQPDTAAGGPDTTAARPDTLGPPPDTVPAPPDPAAATDTLVAPADTARVPGDSLAAARRSPAQPPGPPGLSTPAGFRRDEPLPGRRIVVILENPLPAGVPFEVTATGVVNVNGVAGGGGTVTLLRRAPEGP